MKVLYSALVFAAFALTSCKGELEPQESSIASETADAATTTTTTNPAVPTMQPNAVTPAQGMTQQTQAQGVNPAHGQPGHVCDVAVGAPLTKTATTPPNPMTTTQQVTPQMLKASPPASQPVKTAPGMNPAHGQPGHRCDVAVGASLSSAPKPASGSGGTTITPATLNSNGVTQGSGTTITTTNNNATPALLKAPSDAATSTNPPHGQPGHVCAQ